MTNVPAIPTRTTPPPREPWYRRLPMVIVGVVVLLFALAAVSAFGWPGWASNHDVKLVAADTASQSDSGSAAAAATTNSSSAATTASSASSDAPTTGTTDVAKKDGGMEKVPFVSGVTIVNGDSRNVAQMPPVSGLLPGCDPFTSWEDVVNCVSTNHAQWYIDGINRLYAAGEIQFDWPTIENWALARTIDGNVPEARVINVFGFTEAEMPEAQARAGVADLVGGQNVANSLKVVYRPSGFLNTWRTAGNEPGMTKFMDRNRQVRVSLTPLVLNEQGQVIGLLKDAWSGIFVDCFNVHGLFWQPPVGTTPVNTTGTTPVHTTGTTPPPSTTSTTPPKACPPGWSGKYPHCLKPKSPNPTDYVYPSGKPPVTAASTADSRPPVVVTRITGPAGVVDDSTNKPGSEAGVVAPGATPPSTSRYVPPVESSVNPPSSSGQSQPPANTGDPGVPNW